MLTSNRSNTVWPSHGGRRTIKTSNQHFSPTRSDGHQVGVVGFAFVVGRFVPVAEIYSADGLFANAGSLPCGRLFRPDFALIDLLDVNINFNLTNFIEHESVPSDAEIINHTWAKSNKDGSIDKRFSDNYQIPVVQYGELHLSSKSGLNEVYMLSNPEPAFCFKKMFDEYKVVLASS